MLINTTTDGLFFFDVNVVAENPGVEYNIEPNSLASVANVPAAVRVTNVRRFANGEDAETAQEFVDRAKGELTEKSLVTLRGISARITNNFPEVRRLNVVGFNDPEMGRDIITGGGLGPILAQGTGGVSISDNSGASFTRRFYSLGAGFISLIGPTTIAPVGYVLSVAAKFSGGTTTEMRDLDVRAVSDTDIIDLEDQILNYGQTSLTWALTIN